MWTEIKLPLAKFNNIQQVAARINLHDIKFSVLGDSF